MCLVLARSPEYLTLKLFPDFCLHYPSQARGEFMIASERRTTCRRKLHLPLRFHRQSVLIEGENGATSVNVSASGEYFISTLPFLVGERIEVSMTMPKQIIGELRQSQKAWWHTRTGLHQTAMMGWRR
jgi:hypothetical protein